jgi:transcriptional regulator ATRX
MVISYDLYRILANPLQKSKNKETKAAIEDYQKALVNPGPDVIICDEGHVLKNEEKKLSVAMSNIRTKRRIILTGTPLQNSLIECNYKFLIGNKFDFFVCVK